MLTAGSTINAGEQIHLAPIEAVSPSLAESILLCPLQGGLSRERRLSCFVLGNPKGWLGNAYHEVLGRFTAALPSEGDLNVSIDALWKSAVERQHGRMKQHPLDRRFGEPVTWPGYNLAYASLHARIREMHEGRIVRHARPELRGPETGALYEKELRAFGGRLLGRPDVVHGGEIRDYKTGNVFESRDGSDVQVVKDSCKRQLQIYGYLVKENLGMWPSRGVLLPMSGGRIEVELDPESCTRVATEAVSLLDIYNEGISAKDPEQMASPSLGSCKWCQFKILCPVFWEAANPEWSGLLDGSAVECIVLEEPRRIHGGEAYSISMEILGGSEQPRHLDLAPVSASVHQFPASINKGACVRIVGLRVRADGSLVPTIRTLGVKLDDLPVFA